MTSITSLVGVFLSRKENYLEWIRNLKSALIFNDLWQDVCQGKMDREDKEIALEAPKYEKQCAIWEVKNNKACGMIITLVSKYVSRYIHSYKTAFEALEILKEHYYSHSELEII